MARLTSLLICIVVSYLLFAFIEAEINPFEWLWVSRLLVLALIGGLFYLDSVKK